jgi:hypothetical protein
MILHPFWTNIRSAGGQGTIVQDQIVSDGDPAANEANGLCLLSLGDLPDWQRPLQYEALLGADRSAFAWEWTRRHRPYRDAWERGDRSAASARCFGLEQFENPALTVPFARPIWSRSVDPSVITAIVQRFRGASTDRLDLLDLQPMLTLCIDENENEHLLLCDGLHFLRIDVIEGTLIGCPAVLRYLLEGFDRLSGPMRSIERLARPQLNSAFWKAVF